MAKLKIRPYNPEDWPPASGSVRDADAGDLSSRALRSCCCYYEDHVVRASKPWRRARRQELRLPVLMDSDESDLDDSDAAVSSARTRAS